MARLGQRVRERFDGRAPESGLWSDDHVRFQAALRSSCEHAERCLGTAEFTTRALIGVLDELVDRSSDFAAVEAHWAAVPSGRDYERTSVALELMAARVLAVTAEPVMPGFGKRLRRALNIEAGFRPFAFVPPGTSIELPDPVLRLEVQRNAG
jgi:methionyl-tRNA synthetase